VARSYVGRDAELDGVRALFRDLETAGAAVVVTGPPGIGKTAFVEEILLEVGSDARLLALTAAETEISVPYAAVDLLMRPHLPTLTLRLPDAVSVLQDCVVEPGRAGAGAVAMALVDAVETLAEDQTVVVWMDDVQWLDQPSFEAIVFAARRLTDSPVMVILSLRDTSPRSDAMVRAGFVEVQLSPLDREEARHVLSATAPWLGHVASQRVLELSAGNPLALIELPRALMAEGRASSLAPAWAPLTQRLGEAFAARIASVSAQTRRALLVAAVSGSDDIRELMSAIEQLPEWVGDAATALDEAREARLVSAGRNDGIRFDHPLIRTAVYQSATPSERRAAHGAVAGVLAPESPRAVWHRVSASTDLDDDLARQLAGTADHLHRAGDDASAIAAFQLAARRSEDPAVQGRLLLDACRVADDAGRVDVIEKLLPEIAPERLDSLDRNRLAWWREQYREGANTGDERFLSLIDIAREMGQLGDADRALEHLNAISLRMWWSNPGRDLRLALSGAAEQLAHDPNDPRLLIVQSMTQPVEKGASIAERLRAIRAGDADFSPYILLGLSLAAHAVGELPASKPFLANATQDFRSRGRLGLLVQAHQSSSFADLHLGSILRAQTAADEGLRLARELGYHQWQPTLEATLGAALALRGDLAAAESLVNSAEQTLRHAHGGPTLALTAHARAQLASTAGRYAEATDQLLRIFDPAEECHHVYYGSYVAADLIETASRSGRLTEVATVLAQLDEYAARTSSPVLLAGLDYGRPFRDPDRAEANYQDGLRSLVAWPLLHARTQLNYGSWLRRRRRIPEARQRLRVAAATLRSLGAFVLAERAREELRASGEPSVAVAASTWEVLTAHELQIAQLAAAGLTNRQIGERLLISHRTVSTHLYKIYPKLGVTGRAQLSAALDDVSTDARPGA
jgi:DNA-binding CsgD family transcriptional regulator